MSNHTVWANILHLHETEQKALERGTVEIVNEQLKKRWKKRPTTPGVSSNKPQHRQQQQGRPWHQVDHDDQNKYFRCLLHYVDCVTELCT